MQNMRNMNRKDQCTKSGTWISVFTSWKVWTTLLPHPNPPFSALSTSPGFYLLRGCTSGDGAALAAHPHDTIDSMPAAAPPSPSSFCQT
jgi:hypothetical protein